MRLSFLQLLKHVYHPFCIFQQVLPNLILLVRCLRTFGMQGCQCVCLFEDTFHSGHMSREDFAGTRVLWVQVTRTAKKFLNRRTTESGDVMYHEAICHTI